MAPSLKLNDGATTRYWTLVVDAGLKNGPERAVKLVFTSGIATRIGADFDSFVLAYQFRWGGGL